jgi:hypothetical protein
MNEIDVDSPTIVGSFESNVAVRSISRTSPDKPLPELVVVTLLTGKLYVRKTVLQEPYTREALGGIVNSTTTVDAAFALPSTKRLTALGFQTLASE